MKIRTLLLLIMGSFCLSTVYASHDLVETYALALQNDPVLKQAYENRLAVGETKNQSVAALLPKITASGSLSHTWLFNDSGGAGAIVSGSGRQNFATFTFELNLRQPIFNWASFVNLSLADNQIAESEAQYQAEYQNLMVRTSEAYFNVLAAQDNLEFRIAEKRSIARQLEQAQQRFEVGLIAITDVYEAQAGFDQARADVISAENEVDNTKEALREIIGVYEGDLSILGSKLPLIKPDPENIDDWSKSASAQNLNIVAAFNQVESARKAISVQRAGHFPTFDLVGSHSNVDNQASFGLQGHNQSIGLEMNLPLFEGGAVNSKVREAHYKFQSANEKLTETKRRVQREVKDAYRGVIASISRVQALKAAVKSGESSLEATEAGFEVGTRTMVDVLATTRNLYDAKTKYSQSRYDYLINRLKLKQASSILTHQDLQQINAFLQ